MKRLLLTLVLALGTTILFAQKKIVFKEYKGKVLCVKHPDKLVPNQQSSSEGQGFSYGKGYDSFMLIGRNSRMGYYTLESLYKRSLTNAGEVTYKKMDKQAQSYVVEGKYGKGEFLRFYHIKTVVKDKYYYKLTITYVVKDADYFKQVIKPISESFMKCE